MWEWDLRMDLDLDLDLGVHLDLDKKLACPLGVLDFFIKTLKKQNVVFTFHSKVIIWLEVCISSCHFTRSF